jgi:hypothetical protein
MISSSKDRFTFQRDKFLERNAKEGKTPENCAETASMLDYYNQVIETHKDEHLQEEFRTNNMEYDLRSTEWILEKVKEDRYAQNLYAAMCNREFMRNDVWPLLKEEKWSCSWRHAGGIIADMRQEGDYIDWYCSGITQDLTEEEFRDLTEDQKVRYLETKAFVPEGIVTDEIREDLLKLGWIVLDDEDLPV